MQVTIDPPMHTWKPRVPDAALIARRRAMGFTNPERPIIATGHQAGFWHPGILAKCIAAVEFAKKVGAQPLYVMVDHDANDALRIELPVLAGEHLRARELREPRLVANVAVVAQPKFDWDWLGPFIDRLRGSAGDVPRSVQLDSLLALNGKLSLPDGTFADEITQVIRALWNPYVGELPVVLATDIMDQHLVHRMLGDAANCVRHYNDAVNAHAEAGVPPLLVERDRFELPLWYVGNPWNPESWPSNADDEREYRPEPRHRVFADVADAKPLLVLEDGRPIPPVEPHPRWRDSLSEVYIGLAPRALTLTAMLRSTFCDLFIHGLGGRVYDRAMEMWWHNWTGEPLAPMAVVTADVRLDFPGVPVAEPRDVERAVWYAHHLPHNLDRYLPRDVVPRALAERKRELLAHMDDDRDRKRRAMAFRELHEINRKLKEHNGDFLMMANQQVECAKVGAANRAVAMKRDWSFALYPKEKLEALRDAIVRRLSADDPGST